MGPASRRDVDERRHPQVRLHVQGASTVLHKDPELVRHQWFLYDEWPGGLYGSITTAGTRPAAPMAGAWAAIRFLGADGYLRKATQVRDATRAFQAAIAGIDGLAVTGTPDMSVFEFGPAPGSGVDIGAVGDGMDDRGWNLDRQQGGLHLMVSPYHLTVTDRFAVDLADAVAAGGTSRGKAAGYGGIASARTTGKVRPPADRSILDAAATGNVRWIWAISASRRAPT
ncbi:MAG: hypothetical protein R2690_16575 [Acidimicrobiales bacterium]